MEKNLRVIVLLLTSIFIVIVILILLGIIPTPWTPSTPSTTTETPPTLTSTSTPTTPTEPIRISVAIALTGSSSSIGEGQRRGAKVAESFFNGDGGVNGRDIKVIIYDATSNVKGAEEQFKELIQDNSVTAIIGPTYSKQAFVVDVIAEEAKIPVIAPNTAQGIPQLGNYVFRVSVGASKQASYAVSAALRQNSDIEGIATIYDKSDDFSISENDAFIKAITDDPRLSLLTTQTFTEGTKIFTSQIDDILNTKPDLVIVSALENEGPLIVKQLREAEYEGLLIRGDSLNTPEILERCDGKCDGMIMTAFYNHKLDEPANKEFLKAYQDKYPDEQPTQYAPLMFTAVQVIVEALREEYRSSPIQEVAVSELREKLKDRLHTGMKFQTPVGEIYFDSEGEVITGALYTSQLIDGEFKIIE